jgi:uncharacterized membrane protein
MGDAVIAVKDANGHIKLNQLINTTAAGAVSGTFWGALIGLIFLMPLAGAAIGAASGAIGGALTDIGLDDKWMKETAAAIQPGTAALFVLVRKITADKVLEALKGEGGTVLKTSFDHTKECSRMCDCSLQHVLSRPAKVGDRLTTRDFNRHTRGFSAPEDKNVAVCVLPGTELSFADEVRRARLWPWTKDIINHKTAIFRQINQGNRAAHHDALEFPDGHIVLLPR